MGISNQHQYLYLSICVIPTYPYRIVSITLYHVSELFSGFLHHESFRRAYLSKSKLSTFLCKGILWITSPADADKPFIYRHSVYIKIKTCTKKLKEFKVDYKGQHSLGFSTCKNPAN